jgi:hypothetical protein
VIDQNGPTVKAAPLEMIVLKVGAVTEPPLTTVMVYVPSARSATAL